MKHITFVLLTTFLIFGCEQDKKESTKENEVNQSKGIQTTTKTTENLWLEEIVLNGDSKWNANKETTEGVEKMILLIKKDNSQTMEDYKNLANQLNEQKNYIVKECTMTGASHDNLHVFLLPLITKIKELENTNSVEEGAVKKVAILEHLEEYHNYFN
jgi:hypothetical protein